jgi:hypothetical protein
MPTRTDHAARSAPTPALPTPSAITTEITCVGARVAVDAEQAHRRQ